MQHHLIKNIITKSRSDSRRDHQSHRRERSRNHASLGEVKFAQATVLHHGFDHSNEDTESPYLQNT